VPEAEVVRTVVSAFGGCDEGGGGVRRNWGGGVSGA